MYKKRTVAVGRTPRSEYANWAEHREAIHQDAVEALAGRRIVQA